MSLSNLSNEEVVETPAFSEEDGKKILGNLGIKENETNILNYLNSDEVVKRFRSVWKKVANGEGITAEEFNDLVGSIKDEKNDDLSKEERKRLVEGLINYINSDEKRKEVFLSSLGIKYEKKANEIAENMGYKDFVDFYGKANLSQLIEFQNQYMEGLQNDNEKLEFAKRYYKSSYRRFFDEGIKKLEEEGIKRLLGNSYYVILEKTNDAKYLPEKQQQLLAGYYRFLLKKELEEGNRKETKELIKEGKERYGEEFVNNLLNEIANEFIREGNRRGLETLMEVSDELGIELNKLIEGIEKRVIRLIIEEIKKAEKLKFDQSKSLEERYKDLIEIYDRITNYVDMLSYLEEKRREELEGRGNSLSSFVREELKKLRDKIGKLDPNKYGGALNRPPSYNEAKKNYYKLIEKIDKGVY